MAPDAKEASMRTRTLALLALPAILLASAFQRSEAGPSGGPGARPAVAAPPGAAPRGPEPDPIRPLPDVHFDTARADIRPGDARSLDADAQWLRTHPDAHARIEGHADKRGTPPYNRALGERRAATVGRFLVARGVAAEQITLVSFGATRPVCAERTPPCLAQNRRVRLAVGPWNVIPNGRREVAEH
jgi:peptidoglycan-associated lipoprotein